MNSEELIWEWCRFGWRYRNIGSRPVADQEWFGEQIKYELGMITKKDFQDLFLVTSDGIRWAKDHGLAVGPGRGSVAASAVAWLTRITEIDPHAHPGLLFARFLDESRADPPDIDIDIEDDRRWMVREYLEHKYGRECVGQVCNFVRYRGKNSLVDVARVYNVPIAAKEIVANLIIDRSGGDARFDASLGDTVEMFPAAAAVFQAFPELWKATRLEGNVRGYSVHAAGLVVANTAMSDLCAIYERDGVQVMALDKHDIEYVEALKLDFLGLTTMSIIARCLEMIGMTLDELYAISLDDTMVLQRFADTDLAGIFQFEGRATRLVCRDVQARSFDELTDINALSRPGPLFSGATAAYVGVRHNRAAPERIHPVVDAITTGTKGQIIYQEQILQILRDIGGFDWFEVSHIRRIISKKRGAAAFEMSREKFQEGAMRLHSMPYPVSENVWKKLVTNGAYAFVKAHGVSYTMIAYCTMWLKINHPTEFYAASLAKAGSTGDSKEHAFLLMKDAIAHGINIVPPILNVSHATWRSVPDLGVVAGWEQVPGIGEKMSQRIDAHRQVNGNWKSWEALETVSGIGPKTVDKMRAFATAHDPFELQKTERTLAKVRLWLAAQGTIPHQTHDGAQIAKIEITQGNSRFSKGPDIVYIGIPMKINMKDAVEAAHARTGQDAEEILKTLKRPDLLNYCSIRCYDDTDEEVYVRVSRFQFPKMKRTLESCALKHDVLVVAGNPVIGFGTPVMAEKIWLIDPED
jgi:DNA polymerase III subunit alpha